MSSGSGTKQVRERTRELVITDTQVRGKNECKLFRLCPLLRTIPLRRRSYRFDILRGFPRHHQYPRRRRLGRISEPHQPQSHQ